MQNETTTELLEAIRESNKWLRILALPSLRTSLEAALQKPEERRIYQASDGRQIREVAASAKAGYGTVQACWQRWHRAGLMEETSVKGRFARLIDLNDLGMEVGAVNAGDS